MLPKTATDAAVLLFTASKVVRDLSSILTIPSA
jgi:hypothetical protein